MAPKAVVCILVAFAFLRAHAMPQQSTNQDAGARSSAQFSEYDDRSAAVAIAVKDRCAPSRDFKGVRWIACVRIVDAFEKDFEYVISIERRYDGTVEIHAARPVGHSVAQQLNTLRSTNSHAALRTLAQAMSVESFSADQRKWPFVGTLAEQFEAIRISPVPMDALYSDSTSYFVRVYAPELLREHHEFEVEGPGPAALHQPDPLLEWVETMRKALMQKWPQSPGR